MFYFIRTKRMEVVKKGGKRPQIFGIQKNNLSKRVVTEYTKDTEEKQTFAHSQALTQPYTSYFYYPSVNSPTKITEEKKGEKKKTDKWSNKKGGKKIIQDNITKSKVTC
jgi:hypothetical protein